MNRVNQQSAARQGSLREHNLALVARAVFDTPKPPSRADVATATGLTRATVSLLVDRLTSGGILRELPPLAPQRAGRPAVPLTPAPRTLVGLGLEVNVDYLGGRVIDLTGDVVAEHVDPGDFHHSSPEAVLGRLGEMARGLGADVEAAGMRVVGVRLALPGLVDPRAGRLQVAPNLGWSGLDPVPLLGLRAGLRVDVANEAKLAALAQAAPVRAMGATEGGSAPHPTPSSYLYVSGDVGIGSAIVMDRALFQGRHGWTGEVGHVVVDPAGPECRCGARGCLEQYAGKDALLRNAGLPPTADIDALRAAIESRDATARNAAAIAGRALGSALADYINLVDIDTVLLGGIYPDLLPFLHGPLTAVLAARVLAAPWTPLDVRAAPVGAYPAMTGGARESLRAVVDDPSAYLP